MMKGMFVVNQASGSIPVVMVVLKVRFSAGVISSVALVMKTSGQRCYLVHITNILYSAVDIKVKIF